MKFSESSYLNSAFMQQPKESIFITESKMRVEMNEGARARGPMPDIVFLRPVAINGRLVKWIDAKMYDGSATYAKNTTADALVLHPPPKTSKKASYSE